MRIVLTYDPRWDYTPGDRIPFWASLDTVEYVAALLQAQGVEVVLVGADDTLAGRLADIKGAGRGPLVFWLNEFMPTPGGTDAFTVSVISRLGMMQTGPELKALRTGLDKEATKSVFRRLGLPTPESYVVGPGDCSPIDDQEPWEGYAIVKPLLQGNSRGLDASSVVPASDRQSILEQVQRVHREFAEPALVERYIGGPGTREFTVPMLICHDGRVAALPITEIDLAQIPTAQAKFRFLTHDIKDEKHYLKVPASLPPATSATIYQDVAAMTAEIGCRDMTRVDLRADASGLYYLEVNVNPGKNRFSYLTTSAYTLGLEYDELIAFIPFQAMLRYGLQPPRSLEQLVEPVMALFQGHQRPRTADRSRPHCVPRHHAQSGGRESTSRPSRLA